MPDAHLAGTRKLSEHCMSRKLKILPVILALGTIVFAPACGTNHAKVRFVQASADAPGLDAALDGKTVATNMAFGAVSPATGYLTISAGNHRVEMRDTGTTTDQINSIVDFGSQKAYTMLASGKVSDKTIAALLKTDDNSAPSSGNVKLRVIHDAPDGPTLIGPIHIDVYAVSPGTDITSISPNIANLAYQQASDYLILTAATYEVIVTDSADTTKGRIIDQTYVLAGGEIRTLVTLNVQGGNTMSPSPLVLNDLN
jgi:hypothetical protein